MPKVAESKITINLVTKVPASILMALDAELGDVLEWRIENNEVKVTKKRDQKKRTSR